MLKDTSVNIETFLSQHTLHKDHKNFFTRIDDMVEANVIAKDQERLTSYDNLSFASKAHKRKEISILNDLPQTAVFSKYVPKKRNPLEESP